MRKQKKRKPSLPWRGRIVRHGKSAANPALGKLIGELAGAGLIYAPKLSSALDKSGS